jgi:DNA polymerase/3'-5' exonuclease PolX
MKPKFKYVEARKVADEMIAALAPHCHKCQVVGSVRREAAEVGDIELLIIPKPYEIGLRKYGLPEVVDSWQHIKGKLHPDECKYVRRLHHSGIEVGIFFANELNWGYLKAIRTGSKDFSHIILARSWYRLGYRGIKGYLTKNGKIVPVREEKDLFDLIGMDWVDPKHRDFPLGLVSKPRVTSFIKPDSNK